VKNQKLIASLALIAVGVLMGSAGTLAGSYLWGTYGGYPIVRLMVDNQVVEPPSVPALNFNGHTMVPIRFVSNCLGASIGWDQNSQTAMIWSDGRPVDNTASAGGSGVSLFKLTPFFIEDYDEMYTVAHSWNPGMDTDNLGNTYLSGLCFHGCDYWSNLPPPDSLAGFYPDHKIAYNYLLDGEYDRISGTLVLHNESRDETDDEVYAYFEIFGDDELLYVSNKVRGGVLPQDFSVDISGVNKLTIKLHVTYIKAGLVNVVLESN